MSDTTTHPESKVIVGPDRPDARPPLTYAGDDGQYLVAMGHIDKQLMVCLVIAGWAADCGVANTVDTFLDVDDALSGLVDVVRHLWVIELDHPRPGCSTGEPSVWWLHPETNDPITEDTPGAFAVTVFDTEG